MQLQRQLVKVGELGKYLLLFFSNNTKWHTF